jgi:transcriptional regulator with XRE-family HTH domain
MSTVPGPLGVRIATELRAEMGRQNKSRRWLAEQIGAPHNTVSRWVAGETCPQIDALDQMCQALGLDIVEVMSAAKYRLALEQSSRGHWEHEQLPGGGVVGRRASDFRATSLHAACAA